MRHARIGRRWVEEGLVADSGADRLGHPVVDLQDDPLRSVLAVFGLVPTPDDWEGVEDVGCIVAVDAVEVEEGGVKLDRFDATRLRRRVGRRFGPARTTD